MKIIYYKTLKSDTKSSMVGYIMMIMEKLFEYFDYQKYLLDFYQEKKRSNGFVSYRYLGHHMHIDPGYLVKVLQGKAHLAERSVASVCDVLKLSERETRYFELLVRYNKAKTKSDIKLYFEKLMALRDSRTAPLQEYQYSFYQKWYHSAIHALLSIYEFSGSFKKLASMLTPAISARQAQESIRLLIKIGMVERGKNGIYRPTEAFVTGNEKWHGAAIRDFQKETMKLSSEAFTLHKKDLRDISTITAALSVKDIPEIRERIRQLRQSILSLENDHEPDMVFQLNVQFIPVTKRVGGVR